jgi:activator of HSP90 ATPase
MTYFDKYGFGGKDNIQEVKELVDLSVSIELKCHFNSGIGEYYSLSIPEIGYDIFKLRYNKVCDEDGCFLQYKDFSEHVIILLTWAESLEVVDKYRDKLVHKAKAKFLSRKEII